MVTLMAALTGFLGSILPYLINHFKDLADKKHELEIFDRQIQIQTLGANQRLEEISYQSQIVEIKELYKTYYTKNPIIDAFNGLVRPVLAYSFFGLYVYVKYLQAQFLTNFELTFEDVEILWTMEDQAIFAGIISFYFGQRAMSKFNKRR